MYFPVKWYVKWLGTDGSGFCAFFGRFPPTEDGNLATGNASAVKLHAQPTAYCPNFLRINGFFDLDVI